MKFMTVFVTTLVVASGLATSGAAQGRSQRQEPAREGPPVVLDPSQPAKPGQPLVLDVIQVVGCVSDGPNNTWVLMNGSDPVAVKAPSTSVPELKAAEAIPLGSQRYVLIGATQYRPASHKGHKMAVRGLMIKDVKETRINVTSFQMLSDTCAK